VTAIGPIAPADETYAYPKKYPPELLAARMAEVPFKAPRRALPARPGGAAPKRPAPSTAAPTPAAPDSPAASTDGVVAAPSLSTARAADPVTTE
jgi:hypothetical protein